MDCGRLVVISIWGVPFDQDLGGIQIRQWVLQGSSAPSVMADEVADEEIQAIDAGFAFIEKSWRNRTVPSAGVKQLHWITRSLKDPRSPL